MTYQVSEAHAVTLGNTAVSAGYARMNGAPARLTPRPRTQEVQAPMPRYSSTPERFWSKVEFTDTCWLWTRATHNGYGWFSGEHRQSNFAHRWSYEFCVGEIPEGLQIDHLCRIRHCVNPDHLEPVTQQVNISRGYYATKTHCPRAHAYAGTNLRINKKGHRFCRKCDTITQRIRRAQARTNSL